MAKIRGKSILLTAYLECMAMERKGECYITPSARNAEGAIDL
jgi:hypothetical protein